ncbi:hypothetical protein EJV47_18445 [Hymenobacter gummosus]|uniref:Uncharacterized protein n=1 Tax=Hymenobacter gummosus TaxID=1776032 RepID=A0A431TZW1_9BACT|nr:hypothetical protein [Hymenobacter gummosus]RTQ47898.1 hypothetical protein EJV47_18445 [Hymenobacter gummosus]
MALLLRLLRVFGLYYRSVALSHGLVSAAILGPVWAAGGGLGAVPWLLKLLSWPALAYLHNQLRPARWWWWHNLGWSRPALWGWSFGLDMALFGVAWQLSLMRLG